MENAFIEWLNARCVDIAELETEGKILRDAGNAEAFREVMRKKAALLAGMAKEGELYVDALPEKIKEKARLRLARFTASAENALALESVFYMSALLFPENHQEGEPNDLELFREEIQRLICAGLFPE